MPWTIDDVEQHHKGLSTHQKKVWVAIANSVLSRTGDDGSAIRQANSAANRVNEAFKVGDKVQHSEAPHIRGKITRISSDGRAQLDKGFEVPVDKLTAMQKSKRREKLPNFGDKRPAMPDSKGKFKIQESAEDDASTLADAASQHADNTNTSLHHNIASKLHLTAAKLQMDAGNSEKELHHRQEAQSHALTARHCNEGLEAVLYAKAADMIEAVRLQETANFWGEIKVALHESDPFPRIERDIKGKAVVPSAEQFRQYFETMAVSHIKDRLNAARGRWTAAEGKKGPELTAIKNEVSAATAVLRAKHASEQKVKKVADKKQLARYKAIHTSIKKVAGKNPFMYMMMKHLANHYIGELPGKKKK